MNTTEQRTIKYENPPINEIACGVLFSSIMKLQVGHFGALWQKFKPDFPVIEDQMPIPPMPEEDPNNSIMPPPHRMCFVHRDRNQIIQMQFNRFSYNWRKSQPDAKYPGYETIIENFERYLSCFQEFLVEENLEDFVAKQYQLTYVDHILQNEGWETLNNLKKTLPSFASLKSQNMFSTDIRGINWQMVLDLPDNLGGLLLRIQSGQRPSDRHPILQIELIAQSNQSYEPRREWFDRSHQVILGFFSNLISDEVQEQFWGRKL